MDVKSSVVNKGVQIALSYPNELVNEDKPQNPPDGYFDVNNPGPTDHNQQVHQMVMYLTQKVMHLQ